MTGLRNGGRALLLAAGLAFLPAVLMASAENLLANPGFEELAADKPVRWDQFVQPKPGAAASISDQAHGGAHAIQLHIPTPYDKDPVNNWSQNIIADLGGATLRVSGFIRVEDAKEAALWLQMWRKRPWGVLGAESTSTDMPVYGTSDWQEVSMTVKVPEGTDFVTLRCVLLGTGTAWFDDISVTRLEGPADASIAKPESARSDATPGAPPGPANEGPAASGANAATATQPGQESMVPLVNRLESEVKRLQDANVILTDTLQQIQSVNQELLQEMLSMQAELRAIKAEQEGAAAPPLAPGPPRVPPLVPLSESGEHAAP